MLFNRMGDHRPVVDALPTGFNYLVANFNYLFRRSSVQESENLEKPKNELQADFGKGTKVGISFEWKIQIKEWFARNKCSSDFLIRLKRIFIRPNQIHTTQL